MNANNSEDKPSKGLLRDTFDYVINSTKHFVDSVDKHVAVIATIFSAVFVVSVFFLKFLSYMYQRGKFDYWGLPDRYISNDEATLYSSIYLAFLIVLFLGIYYINYIFFRLIFKTNKPTKMKVRAYIKQIGFKKIAKGFLWRLVGIGVQYIMMSVIVIMLTFLNIFHFDGCFQLARLLFPLAVILICFFSYLFLIIYSHKIKSDLNPKNFVNRNVSHDMLK